ncbi:MAG: transglycosylase domain-containing protein [Pseudobdellovibrio sp.]|nr:transglycosylase domain-containing protein [Pseudobdellovibrio sp.]
MSFSKLLKTSFFILTSAISLSVNATDTAPKDAPLSLQEEFENKLSSQAILRSTKYYARGLSYKINQKFNAEAVKKSFLDKGYRERAEDQAILAGDFITLKAQACSNMFGISLMQDSTCFHWKNESNADAYVVVVYQNVIQQIFKADPTRIVTSGQTDPVMVAQFRNNEPIMQEEMKLADYPVQCLNAVIAIEDNDFLDHSGVSISGLARAAVKNIISLRKAQGGSTITQQLVKNYFLTPEKTFSRKAKELYMAVKLESKWSKDEILQTYLNVIYMGQSGAFQVRGFGAASHYYFNKPVAQLNLSECALLAAIVNNPGLNNPWKKTEKAKTRRQLVLSKMKELKLVSEDEFKKANDYPMPAPTVAKATETAPYYFEAVRVQAADLGIPVEGSIFYTSLDLTIQEVAQKSLQAGIKNLTETKKSLTKKKEKGLELQGVVLAADNQSGFVTAFVGGQNFRQSQFNRALHAKRQVGSLIKPFVYLSGLQYGFTDESNVTPTTALNDQPFEWKFDNNKKTWKPENYDKKFRGEVPFFYALKESLNSPTAQIAHQVGIEKVIDLAHSLGLLSTMTPLPATSLGASQHTPLEVLQAYSNFSRFGEQIKLSFIEKALDDSGKVIFESMANFEPKPETKSDKTKTAILVGMMKETMHSGTAKYVQASGYKKPSAGKTGTTSDGKDAWFAGFTPNTTAVIWLGFDQSLATALTGGGAAVPIWTNFMKQITESDSDNDFIWPDTVEIKEVESSLDKNQKINLVFEK